LGVDGALIRVDYCALAASSGASIVDLTVLPAVIGTASASGNVVAVLDALLDPINIHKGGFHIVASGRVDVVALSVSSFR
jgi:hypothetical protein